jgi:phosphatidyl-myo-inositol dimannoside synthase
MKSDEPDLLLGRVLLVTRNLPPLVGGMERLNQQMAHALVARSQLTVAGPEGAAVSGATRVLEAPISPLWRFFVSSLLNVLFRAKGKFDWVIAGSGLMAPLAWLAAKARGARFAVYLHGLDLVVPSRPYQYLWLRFIRRCDVAIVNSRNTAELAVHKGVARQKIFILNPGTRIPEDSSTDQVGRGERQDLGSRGPVLLSVGRLTRRKGLAEFVEHAFPKIRSAQPHATLLIIGEEAKNALHGVTGHERERINRAAERAGVLEGIRFEGGCDDETLYRTYRASQCHVFPVIDVPGDVEGFGMVALEAAAHGLPTVAFGVGGVPDAIADGVSGKLVPAGDYATFAAAVLEVIASKAKQTGFQPEAMQQFAARHSWPEFGKRLGEILVGASGCSKSGAR